jgi:ribonucleoside-triphosphate reductase
MMQLDETQLDSKRDFIHNFIGASTAADGSTVDANANVTVKDIAVLESELWKDCTIQVNRAMVEERMGQMYGSDLVNDFKRDLKHHYIYVHDETSLKPYCASISLYPFLLNGTKVMGGTSEAPKNLRSFCGTFCNLIYQVASNFAGAVATVEFLLYFDYFARKTYGDNYQVSHIKEIEQEFQGVVYTMNQPAAARGNQSVFWNISVFDKGYLEYLFGHFMFPDTSEADLESTTRLQALFLDWFRKERTKELLTFPVVTAAYLVDPESKLPVDKEFQFELATEMSKGLSFFHYESETADSLSSCCRLRNELADNTFSYTLGAGGVSTGSFQVITLNLNRLTQEYAQAGVYESDYMSLPAMVERVHKYLSVYHSIVKEFIDDGLLPAYSAGFIDLSKQYGTIGINGALEAAEFMEVANDKAAYKKVLIDWLKLLKDSNKEAYKEFGFRFNTEFVPAENLGVKNAKWDMRDGFATKRNCYNSYFYPVESDQWSILDKLDIHGKEVSQYLDGGAACHINLEQLPTLNQCIKLINIACKLGVPYWTTNVLVTICKDCGFIDVNTTTKCSKCGSKHLDYATRIIGYLKPISSFSAERRDEAHIRKYFKLQER